MRNFITLTLLFASIHAVYSQKINSTNNQLTAQTISLLENKGQVWDYKGVPQQQVKFVCEQAKLKIFLRDCGLSYQFSERHYPEGYKELSAKKSSNARNLENLRKKITVETFRTNMVLIGANSEARITKEGESTEYTNYYNRN